MASHIAMAHLGTQPYQCAVDWCQMYMASMEQMNEHFPKEHPSEDVRYVVYHQRVLSMQAEMAQVQTTDVKTDPPMERQNLETHQMDLKPILQITNTRSDHLEDRIIRTPELQVPHPRKWILRVRKLIGLSEQAFWLTFRRSASKVSGNDKKW